MEQKSPGARARSGLGLRRDPIGPAGLCMALLALVLMVEACADSDPAAERARRAASGRGDILVGAGGPWSTAKGKALWTGMELAQEEINAAGGIRGRKLTFVKGDDQNSVDVGRKVAQSFVDDLDMVAVIGHIDSYVSIPNSIIYEYYGMLMMSPLSTAPKLTQQGFGRVFRTIPSDAVFGAQMARFAGSRGFGKVMVYQVQNSYGTGIANAFERECEALGISVPDRLAYDSSSDARVFRKDLSYWKDNFSFDAIFIAGSIPLAPLFIKEARGLGVEAPMLAGESLDTPELMRLAGDAAEGTFVGSAFLPDDPRPETTEFVAAYARRYGTAPDAKAAQGYDTVRILARAIEEAGSTVPDQVAAALRAGSWAGVTGTYRFGSSGDLTGRDISVKVVREGKLQLFEE